MDTTAVSPLVTAWETRSSQPFTLIGDDIVIGVLLLCFLIIAVALADRSHYLHQMIYGYSMGHTRAQSDNIRTSRSTHNAPFANLHQRSVSHYILSLDERARSRFLPMLEISCCRHNRCRCVHINKGSVFHHCQQHPLQQAASSSLDSGFRRHLHPERHCFLCLRDVLHFLRTFHVFCADWRCYFARNY